MSQDKPYGFDEFAKYVPKPVAAQEPLYRHKEGCGCVFCVAGIEIPPSEPCAICEGLVPVEKEDANNYCRILSMLGMEEGGDPIHEIERLLALREGMVCGDCNDTGWQENAVEGRYPCTCMTEAEPYQLLQAKITEQAAEIERLKTAYELVCNDCRNLTEKVIPNVREEQAERIKALEEEDSEIHRLKDATINMQAEKLAKADAALTLAIPALESAQVFWSCAIHAVEVRPKAGAALAVIDAYQKGE